MATGIRSANYDKVMWGQDDSDSGSMLPVLIDNATGRLMVTAVITSGGTGGTQYDVDDAAGATDTGTLLLAVRDDSLTTLTPVDGDYTQLRVSSTGALHVTGGGGGTEYTEDVATPATIVGTATVMERDDALTTVTPVEGDWIGFRGTAEGALWVQDFNSDAIKTAVEGTLTVDGSGVTQPVSNAGLTELAAAINANELDINIATDSVGIGGGTQYAVDAALGATPTGTLAVGIRDDALSALTPVEGDAIGLRVDSTGALWVATDDTITVDGSGVTQPISGTVTANLSATDNTVLDNIDSNTDYGAVVGGGVEATALRVTIANNSTGVLSVDDNGGSLTIDGTVTANLSATDNAVLDSIDAAVNGTLTVGSHAVTNAGTFAVQVDGAALTALQLIDDSIFADDAAFTLASSKVTMSGAIRDDSLTTLTAIEGDAVPLRVSSTGALHVTGGGGGTEYTQDAAHADPATAGTLLVPRDDALSTQESLDGDWTLPRANARGALWVEIDGTNALDVSAATVTVSGTVTANLSATDNTVLDNIDSNTDYGAVVGGGVEATALRVTIANDSTGVITVDDGGSTLSIDDGGGAITVDGTVTANLSATDNTVLDNIDSNTDYGATTGGGTETGALRVTIANNSTGVLSIDDNGGSITVDGTVTVTDGLNIEGDVAHDAIDSGNPVKVGGRAQSSEAQPDEVADNDRVDALFDRNGYLRVRGDFDPSFAAINDAVSGNNTIVAAAGAGKRIAVWSVMVVSDGTVDVRFEDGAAGTAFTGQIPLQAREGFTYSAGGLVPLWIGSANTLLNLELSAAVTVHGHVSYTVVDD